MCKPISAKSLANLRPPWKKGESPGAAAPKNAGCCIKRWINVLQDANESELRRMAKDPRLAANKRIAAQQLLRAIATPDMADFEPLVEGTATMAKLRDAGVDTTQVKKLAVRHTEHGTNRDIELYDRSGESVDRIMDRTDGRPKQTTEITGEGGLPLAVTIITPQSRLAAASAPVAIAVEASPCPPLK